MILDRPLLSPPSLPRRKHLLTRQTKPAKDRSFHSACTRGRESTLEAERQRKSCRRVGVGPHANKKMRIPFIAGNWKMYKTVQEAVVFVKELRGLVKDITDAEIVIAPPFTAVYAVAEAARNTNVCVVDSVSA